MIFPTTVWDKIPLMIQVFKSWPPKGLPEKQGEWNIECVYPSQALESHCKDSLIKDL